MRGITSRLVLLVLSTAIVGVLGCDDHSADPKAPKVMSPAEKEKKLAEMEQTIAEFLRAGVIEAIDPTAHRVRMAPLIWRNLDLKRKNGLLDTFSAYFELKTGAGLPVVVFSDVNGSVFGEITEQGDRRIPQ